MDEDDCHVPDTEFHEIIRTLKHFSLSELLEMISVLIPALSIKSINKRLQSVKLKCTAKNFADMVFFDLQRLNVDEIIRLKHSVQLLDKAYHSNRTVWSGIELLERRNNGIKADSSIETIAKTILQNIRIAELNAYVEVIHHTDKFYYIFVKEKKLTKQKRVVLKNPIYCKCDLKEPYLFVYPKSASLIMLQKVVKSLGFEDFKHCSLDGKHVPSLIKVLKNRDENLLVKEYNPAEFVKTTLGMDYTQSNQRKKYISDVFGGDDPILLEKLSVKSEVPFRGLRVLPEAEGIIFKSILTLSAPSIAGLVEEMADIGMIKPPFPSWLTKVPNLGKNNFVIGQKK